MSVLDLTGNWKYCRNRETVTLRRKTGDAATSYAGVEVQQAKRMAATVNEADRAQVGVIIFHLWVQFLDGTVPKPNYEIVDASGVAYRIMEARFQSLRARYRCVCHIPK